MNHNCIFDDNQPAVVLVKCLLLSLAYVGSLYVFKSKHLSRDHPETIKQRTRSVVFVSLLAPGFVYINCLPSDHPQGYTVFHWLGIHMNQVVHSVILPLILTMVLFLGPVIMNLLEDGISEFTNNLKYALRTSDLMWYRTYIVAPFTEEFVFRACMLPLLVPNFGLTQSIFIAPVFFGVAHLHHIYERLKAGQQLLPVLLASVFQMLYTTVFGWYTAFLFLRTGHLIGPVVCHSFCNMMGFPDFESIPQSRYPKFICTMFIAGLLLFIYLLFPLTDPSIYESIYWR